jgi:PPP family 3-phenylpropionic acid transporter
VSALPDGRHATALSLGGSYFLLFAVVGISQPYFPSYLRTLGLTATQVGVLLALTPLMAIVGPPVWGGLADRLGRPALVLSGLIFCATLAAVPLLSERRFAGLVPILGLHVFFTSSMTTMLDSLTIQRVSATGESYSRLRLWGSIGYIVSTLLFGWVVKDVNLVVTFCLVVWAAFFLWSLAMRAAPSSLHRPHLLAGLQLLKRRDLRVLLTASALHWMTCAPYHSTFGVHVLAMGLSTRVVGTCFALGVVAELGVMIGYPRLAQRWSTRTLLMATFAATAFRWAALAFVSSSLLLAAVSLIHGLTFGVFYASMIAAVSARVPPELRASGQALFAATTSGLGGLTGYLATGALYDRVGGHALFGLAAVVELLPLLLLAWPKPRQVARA